MQDLKITLVQSSLAWEDPVANIRNFDEKFSSFNDPTDLIILPEMFNTGFTMEAESNAEIMDGKSMQWMAEKAAEKHCVVCGSLIIADAGNYYNRFVWMQRDGSYDYYDKKHLFRMGDEHLHYSAGNKKLIVELKGWKVMPMVCYDLRFPVWSKNEYSDGKYAYDLLLYVANWPAVRSLAWTSLITARAIENISYAAGLNRIGKDGRGYEYSGNSMVAGPDGNTIMEIGSDKASVSTAKLKAENLIQSRAKLGVGKDWDAFNIQ